MTANPLSLNPLVMGLCFYPLENQKLQEQASLNPLVMGLCFYRKNLTLVIQYRRLNPLVMGLCFYQIHALEYYTAGRS